MPLGWAVILRMYYFVASLWGSRHQPYIVARSPLFLSTPRAKLREDVFARGSVRYPLFGPLGGFYLLVRLYVRCLVFFFVGAVKCDSDGDVKTPTERIILCLCLQ